MQANTLAQWNAPLSPEQADLLERLAPTLSGEQARWVSGYLAGLHRARQAQPQPAAAAARLTILYGSETGNAQRVAEAAGERAEARGLPARVLDIADYNVRELKSERLLLIVTATHGDGDPPDPAAGFHELVQGRKAPKLPGTRFAVLGLGDSSYRHFCQTAKDFDARLEALGAERLCERLDCDVDYDEAAAAWVDRALAAFAEHAEPAAPCKVVALNAPAARQAPRHDQRHPFYAEVLENLNLNGRGSDKETRHLEFSLEDSGIIYAPGDALCVIAENDPRTVAGILEALALDPHAPVPAGGEEAALEEALRRHLEITVLAPPVVRDYAELAGSAALAELVQEHNRERLAEYLHGRQLADLVREHPPAAPLAPQAFAGILRRLRAREYSIASSQHACPDEVHLTVAVVRYDNGNGRRGGVASTYLAERVAPGERVPVYVQHNKNFKLPADPSAPIVMVGSGTGVAPFRAFMQEREELGAAARSWLFFGDRRFRTDFLYQTERQHWLNKGVLERLDVAFSRDSSEKVYVQDRMRERGRELYAWLEEGAYFYVCGDAERMAPDVHRALVEIVQVHGGRSPEQAEDYVKELQRRRRYLRDVY